MSKAKTADVRAALDAKFHDYEWQRFQRAPGDVLLHEVPTPEGRSADAVLVRCWKSRGYELHGFEIKTSRSDWLRELKDPGKAEPIAKFMDRWFVVAPTGVVKRDELPSTWGLMVYRTDGKLVVSTPAPRLSPLPVDRAFLATLVRRAFTSSRQEIRDAALEARKAGIEIGKAQVARECGDEALRDELQRLQRVVADFKGASGIDIADHRWNAGRSAGDAVAWMQDNQWKFPKRAVERVRRLASELASFSDQLSDGLEPLLTPNDKSPRE